MKFFKERGGSMIKFRDLSVAYTDKVIFKIDKRGGVLQ